MTSNELAAAVEEAIRAAKGRVLGPGRDQYETEDGTQGFESMTLAELLDWASEEAEDLIVYGVMLQIRIKRVKRALKKGFDL
ncbi:hypothetical protein GCM10010466_29640 [Planomonospora alba]|uniref:Uncharacterized protein n=1 Tax=Planomonospora alba TaxID=161354 RepID=A0ABP6N5M0_9ACTN